MPEPLFTRCAICVPNYLRTGATSTSNKPSRAALPSSDALRPGRRHRFCLTMSRAVDLCGGPSTALARRRMACGTHRHSRSADESPAVNWRQRADSGLRPLHIVMTRSFRALHSAYDLPSLLAATVRPMRLRSPVGLHGLRRARTLALPRTRPAVGRSRSSRPPPWSPQ
jgi:hypothetical protein